MPDMHSPMRFTWYINALIPLAYRATMDHPRWLERLAGATKLQVIELLLRSEHTVQEIATEVGVSTNAIRGHIASLQRDGLVVAAGSRRNTGGKPATVYTVSDDADELFPKAYAFVLVQLLGVLGEREGPKGLEGVLRNVGKRVATPGKGTPEERVEAAAELLRSVGGNVEIRRTEDGFRLVGFSCPLGAVVRKDARICGLVETLVRTTTGGRVREVCEHDGRPRCAFEISFPTGSRKG